VRWLLHKHARILAWKLARGYDAPRLEATQLAPKPFTNPKKQVGDKMKTIKAICTAGILAITLSIPVYAGQINTPGITCPETGCPVDPPPGAASTPIAASTSSGACALLELLLTIIPIV
jgi:hypothetical protein